MTTVYISGLSPAKYLKSLYTALLGAIEHDHRAAYPGCGGVQCQLLSVLEYEDGRDVPSSVHSRYRLQGVC